MSAASTRSSWCIYDFDAEPWILVPQIGVVSALTTDGTVVARIEVGRRANYFVVPESGPVAAESDLQLFFRHAKTGNR